MSAFQLFRILSGYYEGRKEYDEVKELAITEEESEDGDTRFTVDFNTLLGINPDTVGWIRFDPEPSQINYPLVQTTDNSTYLNKTFSANDNTVGAIFVNAYNSPDFNDRNTIIYGHRMNDSSMFHDLAKYEDQSFWEANPYFYIYTPDGREITYHIYAAGQVTETSDTYLTEFADDAAYQAFLDYTKEASAYDTGVEVTTSNTVVTLSTCTKASDEHRMVVVGVKESEEQIN
ncbi:class B sortase [uncultured Desulfovibrio sp.]|uniref:class B sortase n=1 Tax=uncultured Desulfovibrio sp. TaxID=167968 RepID=UPI002611551C|nr:class B sortase [uncultured Desulfovibrio sp.]